MEFISIAAVATSGAACLPVLLRTLSLVVAICVAIAMSGCVSG